MKIFAFFTAFVGLSLFISIVYIRTLPARLYDKLIHNELDSKWYSLDDRVVDIYLNPKHDLDGEIVEIKNEELWKSFHFKNLSIPIPVRNPFFFVVPNLKYSQEKNQTKFGLSILDSKDEKISDIFFLPKVNFPNISKSQSLFSLPLAAKEIQNISNDRIWDDLFTKSIEQTDIEWQEMVYNLYLLQMRVKIFGRNIVQYGVDKTKNKRGILVLNYPDRDFVAELFIENRNNMIHSFIIISKKNSDEAKIVRQKMLNEIEYIDTSLALSDIMIKEFKGLSYVDQIDHIGMYYLLSAWSHDQSRKAILEDLIFYLERGSANQLQLAPIYKYYYDRYHEIFSKRLVEGLQLESELLLKIQIVNEKNNQDAQDLKASNGPTKLIRPSSIDEQFNKLIEKTKVKKRSRSKTIRMD